MPESAAANHELLIEIRVMLADVKATQVAAQKAADERHHGLRNAIATFVPRAELNEKFAAQEKRIKSLEDSRGTLIKWIVSAWLAGLGVVGAGVVHPTKWFQ